MKSFLVVDERSLTKANEVFADTGVNIVCSKRVLGGFIGDDLSRKDSVKEVVDGWVSELDRLTTIAEVQPQAAFAAFTKSLQFKWNYLQRLVPDCDALYKELEFNISNKFLPSVFGCEVSQAEGKLFSLPARLGGLGISDPTEMNDVIFKCSRRATDLIVQSIKDDQVFEIGAHVNCLKEVKSETLESKTLLNVEKFETILSHFDQPRQRAILRANKEKTSSWLTVLPLVKNHFDLSAGEFRDGLAIRYRKPLLNVPDICDGCSAPFSLSHALSCRKGGLIIRRHNEVRDTIGDLSSFCGIR